MITLTAGKDGEQRKLAELGLIGTVNGKPLPIKTEHTHIL